MANPWPQVFRGRGSVYALDEDTKQWADRGTSGTVIMFQSAQNRQDVRIKWEKNQIEIWWRLTSSKLKPKGERALVLKAWATSTNQQEILAIRFSNQEAAIQFAKKYHYIFPMAISGSGPIENIFKQNNNSSNSNQNDNKLNGNHHLAPKHHASMASLPGSVLGNDDNEFASFQPQQYQNGNNYQYNNGQLYDNYQNNNLHRNSSPLQRRNNNKPPPPPRQQARQQAQSQYVHNGQVVNNSLIKPLPPNPMNGNNNPQFKPGNMPDLDPLPAQPQPQQVNKCSGSKRRVVKASPDMKPPVWNRPLPKQAVNNDPVELEYGHSVKKEWKCAVCTYANLEPNLKCQMCGLPKGPPPKPSGNRDDDDDIYEDPDDVAIQQKMGGGNDKNKWQCTACTFSNHAWTGRCEVCSAKRRIGSAKPSSIKQGGVKKQEAISLHHEMSAQIEKEYDINPIGSPIYNSIPKKKFIFDANAGGNGNVNNGNGNVNNGNGNGNGNNGNGNVNVNNGNNGINGNNGNGNDNSPVNKQPWSCPICTLLNRATNGRCEACNTARNVNPYHGLNIGLQENQVNNMMNHMINKPNEPFNDYERMMSMSMNSNNNAGGADNMNFNLQYDYNDPFNNRINGINDDQIFESTVEDFSRAASDIACYNDTPSSVFSTLRSVAKKLLKDDARYRTLDTTNPKVMERLIGFEGVLDFLMLLGFESDAMGMKLICQTKPSSHVVHNAITVLNSYQTRFRMTDNGFGNGGFGNMSNMMNGSMNGVNNGFGNGFGSGSGNGNGNGTLGGGDDNGNNIISGVPDENKNDILTLEQIILWSTHENMQDNDTMETLIMTHKMFTDSLTLLKQLRRRFFVPIPSDIINKNDNLNEIREFQNNVQKRIQLKVINALRHWMKHYWSEDFDKNESVQLELQEWLRELSVYNELDIHNINCIWISKLYSTVKKEYLRLKNINWDIELEKSLDILSLFNDINLIDSDFKLTNKFSAEELADQITLMDYRFFSRIEPRECVHQRWKDINNKKLAPNILLLIQQFNNFTIFIQIQILRERSLKKRGTAIKRIIKMGQHFKLTRNYNSLCAVFSALNSAPIHRLKIAWSKVPERQRQNFQEWSVIFCRDFNHRNLRTLLRKAGGNPCIPHIGVFLQDLVFIDEGNKKKLPIPAFNGNQMLNFNKCVRIADRIKNLQLFQHHKYENNITESKKIQKVLLLEFDKLKDVTEDQIWDMSTEIKKQDGKEAKQPLGFFGGSNNNQPMNQIPPAQVVKQ